MARPGFILCACPDGYLAKVRIEQALADNAPSPESGGGLLGGSPAAGIWERHAFWGDEPLPSAFWEHLTLPGLFATPQAVIIHNAQNIPAESWRKTSAALSTPNRETWPFFGLQVAF